VFTKITVLFFSFQNLISSVALVLSPGIAGTPVTWRNHSGRFIFDTF